MYSKACFCGSAPARQINVLARRLSGTFMIQPTIVVFKSRQHFTIRDLLSEGRTPFRRDE